MTKSNTTLQLDPELQQKIEKSLKGELDNSHHTGDILYYDELARGRVLGRLYKVVVTELATAKNNAIMECYLEVLAVGCGESEYSQAIASKFGLEVHNE